MSVKGVRPQALGPWSHWSSHSQPRLLMGDREVEPDEKALANDLGGRHEALPVDRVKSIHPQTHQLNLIIPSYKIKLTGLRVN